MEDKQFDEFEENDRDDQQINNTSGGERDRREEDTNTERGGERQSNEKEDTDPLTIQIRERLWKLSELLLILASSKQQLSIMKDELQKELKTQEVAKVKRDLVRVAKKLNKLILLRECNTIIDDIDYWENLEIGENEHARKDRREIAIVVLKDMLTRWFKKIFKN